MKTAQEIVEEINGLKSSSQTPELDSILDQLLSLAEALALLQRNLPECDGTREEFED